MHDSPLRKDRNESQRPFFQNIACNDKDLLLKRRERKRYSSGHEETYLGAIQRRGRGMVPKRMLFIFKPLSWWDSLTINRELLDTKGERIIHSQVDEKLLCYAFRGKKNQPIWQPRMRNWVASDLLSRFKNFGVIAKILWRTLSFSSHVELLQNRQREPGKEISRRRVEWICCTIEILKGRTGISTDLKREINAH